MKSFIALDDLKSAREKRKKIPTTLMVPPELYERIESAKNLYGKDRVCEVLRRALQAGVEQAEGELEPSQGA